MDLENLGGQLKSIESQLSQYDTNLPSEIQSQIQKAYTPALERSLGTTSKMMGDYLGKYFDTTTMGPGMAGTTAIDLSPTQKLGVMGRELGTMAGELQASQRFSDYLGGQMKDIISNAQQNAQLGRQGLLDRYNMLVPQNQLLFQAEQAAKDRQLQRQLAASRLAAYAKSQPQDDIIIEIDDEEPKGPVKQSWVNTINKPQNSKGLAGYYAGTNLSDWNQLSTGDKLLGLSSVWNPLTIGKTIGGLIGNYLGNQR